MSSLENISGIREHPCFCVGEEHKRFGRVHVPVAPKCNIKCNYCDRKFDCPNEGRPGVTTAILKPQDALRYLKETVRRDERIKVVGIAGPGEPLFNEASFETLALIRKTIPSLKLCVSTNGLLLSESLERLVKCGVLAVTVTANAVSTEVAERIYPFILYGGKLLRGLEAARVLIDKQFEGVLKASRAGLAVKVNSVLIPEINQNEILRIAERAKAAGAHLMNIIPLRPQAAFSELRAPEGAEIGKLRDKCSSIITQFSHCALCRADAAGLITEDRLNLFAARDFSSPQCQPATIAVASRTGKFVDEHFAKSKAFFVYQFQAGKLEFIEKRIVGELPPDYLAEGSQESQEAILYFTELLKDCQIVLCKRVGHEPRRRLREAGIEVLEVCGETQMLVRKFGQRSKQVACRELAGTL